MTRHGITLVELLLSSVVGLVVILAMGQVDVSRIHHSHEIQGTTGALSEAGFAVTHLVAQVGKADRINLVNGSNLQFRVPTGTNFDLASNYRWKEYKYDSVAKTLRFYDPATDSGCTLAETFKEITGVTITLVEYLTTIGTTSSTNANKTLEFRVESTSAFGKQLTYTGQVTLRGGTSDPSTGLTDPGVSPPPTTPCS